MRIKRLFAGFLSFLALMSMITISSCDEGGGDEPNVPREIPENPDTLGVSFEGNTPDELYFSIKSTHKSSPDSTFLTCIISIPSSLDSISDFGVCWVPAFDSSDPRTPYNNTISSVDTRIIEQTSTSVKFICPMYTIQHKDIRFRLFAYVLNHEVILYSETNGLSFN